MQENSNSPAVVGHIKEAAGEHGLPPSFLAQLAAADVVVLVSSSENPGEGLSMHSIDAGGEFNPGQVKSHAYVDAIYREHGNLVARVNGVPTDADRYRALRDFALLAGSDKERFEAINDLIRVFEENHGLAGEAKDRTPADSDKLADFLHQVLFETSQNMNTPTAAQETKVQAPRLILPH